MNTLNTLAYKLSPQQTAVIESAMIGLPHSLLQFTINETDAEQWKERLLVILDRYSAFKLNFVDGGVDNEILQTIGDTVSVLFHDRDFSTEDLKKTNPLVPESYCLQVFSKKIETTFYITLLSHPLCVDISGLLMLKKQLDLTAIDEEISYMQFAEWQNQLLEDEGAEEGLNYWKEQVKEAPCRIRLEQQKNEDVPSYCHTQFLVPVDLRNDLSRKAEKEQISVESIFISTFSRFINTLTSSENPSFGLECHGREFDELNGTMGLLSKLVPVSLDAYDANVLSQHRNYQFYYLAQKNAQFDYQIGFLETATSNVISAQQSLFPAKLKLQIIQSTDQTILNFLCDQRYLTASDLSFAADFMLASLKDEIQNRDEHINLLRKETFANLPLTNFKKVNTNAANDIVSRFQAVVALYPDQLAVQSGAVSLTYAQLNEQSNLVAQALLHHFEIKPGDFVGLMMDEDEWLPIGMLAILKAGATYIPIDASNPSSRLVHILSDASPVCVLSNAANANSLAMSETTVVQIEDLNALQKQSNTYLPRTNDQVAYMIYTSGTTGLPKGVMVTDANLLNYVDWLQQQFTLSTTDKSILQASYAYDLGYTSLWGCLLTGATLHIIPASKRQEADGLVTYIKTKKISFLKLTPSIFYLLLKAENIAILADSDLRLIFSGGEKIDTNGLQYFSNINKNVVFVNHYGPTETTIGTIFNTIAPDELAQFIAKPSIGKPITNAEVYILNKDEKTCLPGELGEICIGGKGVAKGYHNREKLTNEKFFLYHNNRIYRTGDLGYWGTDGNIYLEGRIDDQVKIRGHRIELPEVKLALELGGLENHILRVISAPEYGEELVCYYLAQNEVDILGLRNLLLQHIPEYMVPTFFIRISTIPLTANGKTDFKSLPDPYTYSAETLKPTAEMTATEALIAEIWSAVLHQPNLTAESDFFLLGGDSIKAIQIIAKINRQGLKCLLADIFNYTTIGSLAQHLQPETPKETIEAEKKNDFLVNYSLSPMQKAMYFHYKAFPNSKANIIIRQFEVSGKMNITALTTAISEAVKYYDILRVRFTSDESNSPVVQIRSKASTQIELGVGQGEREIAETRYQWLESGFDLENDLPIRIKIIELPNDKQVILWAYHHIIMDGWCFNLIIKEIMGCYQALCAQQRYSWAPYTSFTHYLEWIAKLPQEKSTQFWKNHLQDYNVVSTIPAPVQVALATYEPGIINLSINEALTQVIQTYCNTRKTTLNVFFQAAWGILLGKYNNSTDTVFGITVAGRPYELDGFESMVGLFINTLPVRIKWSAQTTVNNLLQELTTFLHEYQSHQYLSLPEIQACSSLNKDLIDHIVVFENYPLSSVKDEMDQTGVSIESRDTFGHASYPLAIVIYPGQNIHVSFTFNKNVYPTQHIEKLSTHFLSVITQMAMDAETMVDQIDMVTAEEKDLLLEWSHSPGDFDPHGTIIDAFNETCRLFKDKIAVQDSKQSLTYGQLQMAAKQLAHWLITAHDIEPGDKVGIILAPSINIPIAILGILYCGAAYVPIDAEYPSERIAFITSDSNCTVMITSGGLIEKLQEFLKIKLIGLENTPSTPLETISLPRTTQKDLAYIIYTSGSTGQSKGCLVSHGNLMNLFKQKVDWLSFTPNDVWIMAHSYAFDFSVWEIFGALLNGGSLYIPQREDVRDTATFYKIIREVGVTVLNQTPAAFYLLLEKMVSNANSTENLTLRMIIFGGEKLDLLKLKSWPSLAGSEKVQLFNLYGITEVTVHTTWHLVTANEITNSNGQSVVGRPNPGTSLYILNDQLQICPVGVQGELVVSGKGVAMGYHNRPSLTAERFIPDPFAAGNIMYRSGDYGQWLADGTIAYSGRKDDQIQIRGFRVELGEIIYHLQKHPKISKAYVMAKQNTKTDLELLAYITPIEGASLIEAKEIRNYLVESLPAQFIPHHFIWLEEFPLTSNGKIDKNKLPLPHRTIKIEGEVQSKNPIELTLLAIWEKELEMQGIDLNDNFFDLGGHSLKAVRLMGEIQKQLGIELPLVQLYKDTTIAALASTIQLALQQDHEVVEADYLLLQDGNPAKTIFFFPPAVGYAIGFAPLANALTDYRIVGFNFIEQDTFLKMAEYVQALQPEGEIVLSGLSAGGSMCFHVTKALEAQGRKVKALVLLDSRRFIQKEPLTEQEVQSIADEYLADPRAQIYLTSPMMKAAMRKRIEASTRFIHQLKDDGEINADIYYISSEVNRNNTERIQAWQEITTKSIFSYEGYGPHASMLDEPYLKDNVIIYEQVMKQICDL